ncbi:MAG: class I SAM-dependent methyltransferase [Planctomycetota bacterium]
MSGAPDARRSEEGVAFRGGTFEGKLVASRILPRFFPLRAVERVLNLGCGEGPQAAAFRGRYRSMVCADLDEGRLRFARRRLREERLREVAFLRCDAGALPFPAGSFDAVLAVDLLEHLPDPESALRECARVLRPEGRLLASYPLLFDFFDDALEMAASLRARVLGRERRRPAVAVHDRHNQRRSPRGWVATLTRGGFRVERIRASTLFPPLQLLGVRRFWIEIGAIRRIDSWLCSVPGLRRLGQSMLLDCRKTSLPV